MSLHNGRAPHDVILGSEAQRLNIIRLPNSQNIFHVLDFPLKAPEYFELLNKQCPPLLITFWPVS